MTAAAVAARPLSGFVYASITLLTLMSALIQVYLDASYDNVLSVACVVLSTVVCLAYMRGSACMSDAPVSSFTILGFLITTLLGAMLAKTLEWLPLASDLKDPSRTFVVLMCALLGVVALHWVYRHLLSVVHVRDAIASGWLAPAGLYRAPPPLQMWLMAFFGLYALIVSRGAEFGDVGGKFIAAFSYLAWLPFLAPIFKARGERAYQSLGLYWVFLALYAMALALIGLAFNTRVIIFSGIMVVMLLALFETLRGRFVVGRWTWLTAIVAIAVTSVGVVIGDDIATAMVIVRQKTERMSPMQKVTETYETYVDPNLIALFRVEKETERLAVTYDEIYIRNAILARFTETKFHDNALNCAVGYSDSDRAELRQATREKLLSILPTPVMKAVDADLDKEKLAYSFGDYLCHIESGVPLGGYKTGSIFAHGYALFEAFTPVIMAMLFFCKFFLLDLFSVKSARVKGYVISPVLMLTIWFNFISSYSGDSLVQYVDSITRMVVQQVVLYLVLTFLLRAFFGLWQSAGASEYVPVRRRSYGWHRWVGRLRWKRA